MLDPIAQDFAEATGAKNALRLPWAIRNSNAVGKQWGSQCADPGLGEFASAVTERTITPATAPPG